LVFTRFGRALCPDTIIAAKKNDRSISTDFNRSTRMKDIRWKLAALAAAVIVAD